MRQTTWRRQQGMTAIGWLLVLMVGGFFVLLVLKLGPIYMENYSIKTALLAVKNEPGVDQKNSREIRQMLMNRLDINYVTTLPRDAITISRKTGGNKWVDVDYEVRKHMLYNIDALVSFKESVELVPH